MNNATIQGVTMSTSAAAVVEETGADVAADLAALRSGAHTAESLLALCLDGADDDRADGWREYVDAVVEAAGPGAAISSVTASNPRPSTTGVAQGVDVDVVVTIGGAAVSGEVTLVPATDGRPRWEQYGVSRDMWISGRLLAAVERVNGQDDVDDMLLAEAAAAIDAAGITQDECRARKSAEDADA